MGRTIKIELDDKQRNELEQGYRNGKSHVFRLRCHIVLLKSEGRKSKEVAAILDSCELSVNNWLRRYINEGISGLHNKPGQGRIPILQPSEDAQSVRSSVAQHRQRISQARAELEDSLGKKFSEKTLRRFLKNLTADINVSENVLPNRKSKKFMTGK